ncbi:MAG: phosphoesterase [Desulfobacterales bacterium]|nr:phosphoesterase [Desulfobacteraceae bacterium]MBT7085463.1 phosphoesterase [Desulfobacterales bacterium]MBT7696113.1 phosphoesterase [Desulfobacterales bacterium]
MLVYAVADIHSRKARLEIIKKNIEEYKPDALIVAGDITNYINPKPILSQLNSLSIPVLTVRGNSDLKRVDKIIDGSDSIHTLHLKEVHTNGSCFVGISGTIPVPFSSRLAFNERKVLDKIEPLLHRDSVLVTHTPPFGILDEVLGKYHAGCKSLYESINRCQPCLVICGHIHESTGSAFVNKTLVVNCSIGRSGEGALIELNNGLSPKVEFI